MLSMFLKNYWHYFFFLAAFAFFTYQVELYGENKIYAKWNEEKLAKLISSTELKNKEEKETYEIDVSAVKSQAFIKELTDKAKKEATDEKKNNPSAVGCIVSDKRVQIYNSVAGAKQN